MADALQHLPPIVMETAENAAAVVHLDDEGVFGDHVSHEASETKLGGGLEEKRIYTPLVQVYI